MSNTDRILSREVTATQIPSGDKHTLAAGTKLFIHQTLGGSFTVQTDFGLFRLDGKDADAIGEKATDNTVTAATLADVTSSVVGAIGALKGPLHGGANTEVMHMLLEIDAAGKGPAGASAWVSEALAAKRKISGFGHRVYRAPDPRATKLKELSALVGRDASEMKWYDLSLAVEKAFSEQKSLPANVDFFSASTYYVLGIPPDMYTPIFAISRMSGWLAHITEQYVNNRLIRPRADYRGSDERHVTPLAERGLVPVQPIEGCEATRGLKTAAGVVIASG